MTTKKKITINALSAVLQVLFTALLYFFLYKYLLQTIGVKQLGVWSLILSFSSIANLANLGITSGLVKFVAEYLVENDTTKLGKLIFTSTLSMFILFAGISLMILFAAQFFLNFVIDKQFLQVALAILPYSLASLCVNSVGGVFTSVLEGHQKNYLRNFIYIVSGIVMFVATILLTPTFHLKGVAMAQLTQSLFILFFALLLTLKINPLNRISYWRWSTQSFKELFNYGYKFQMVSISQLLYEPTTKLLLSKYGGLAMLGHYEMATRAVNQFRALLTNANQVVIPVVAEKVKTSDFSHLQSFYKQMNRTLLFFNLPLSTILFVVTPFISIIWLGDMNSDFIFSMVALIFSSFINIACGPAYFSSMGEGRLNILVLVHIGMAIVNIVLGLILGVIGGGYGIIISWAIALSGGSICLIYNYNKAINVSFLSMFRREDILLLFTSLIIIIANVLIFHLVPDIIGITMKIVLSSSLLLLYLPIMSKNEIVKQVISLMKKRRREDNV
ncbi:MAG: lipopolysaccharide biosynthesis protein [Dysgonamonadaceae bacterium]